MMTLRDDGVWFTDDVVIPKDGSAFLRFDLKRPGWSAIINQDDGDTDIVFYLREVDGTLLAVNDDTVMSIFVAGEDAQIFYYFEEARSYCVEVTDFAAFVERPHAASVPFTVGVVNPANYDLMYEDAANSDTIATAQEIPGFGGLVLGRHQEPGDVDVFRIEHTANAQLGGVVLPRAGVGEETYRDGAGYPAQSTITVFDSDGTTVLARVNYGELSASCILSPCVVAFDPGQDGYAYVAFEGPDGAPEGPAPYVAFMGQFDYTKQLEPDDDATNGDNDTPAGAGRVTDFRVAMGEIHAGDTDWWHIGDAADLEITDLRVECEAKSSGSGLIGLEVAAFPLGSDGSEAPIDSFVETPVEHLYWSDRPYAQRGPLPGGAEYLLRVTAAGQDPEIDNARYYCTITPLREAQ